MKIIAIINQKGGVGKTTTTANLGDAIARSGKSVTLVDLDPQSHLTVSFGINPFTANGIDNVLLNNTPFEEVVTLLHENLNLVTAGKRLSEVEQITGGAERGWLLKNILTDVEQESTDYLLLDCPPSAGLLCMNALLACDEVITPVVGDFLALQGLSVLVRNLHKTEKLRERNLPFKIAVTRYHPRRRLAREVVDKLLQHFPNGVYASTVRETTSLAECPSVGKTIFDYAPKSYGAEDYTNLAVDVINENMMSNNTEDEPELMSNSG